MNFDIAAQLFGIIAPVFICAGLGYAWIKTDRPFDSAFVTAVVTNVGAPCLVFSTLTSTELDPSAIEAMVLASAGAIIAFGVIGSAILLATRQSLRAFLPSLMFPNCGNMGLPLCQFAFGEIGLALAAVFFTIQATFQFTIGVSINMGRFDPSALLRVPMIYAVLLAGLVEFNGLDVPVFVANTTRLLGGLTIPMMLMALGVSLAQLQVSNLWVSTGLAVTRLAMGFAVGVALATALGLEGPARGVIIIEATMPVAVFNYLFSLKWGVAPAEVAGIVLLSTLFSFATLPALLWFVL